MHREEREKEMKENHCVGGQQKQCEERACMLRYKKELKIPELTKNSN